MASKHLGKVIIAPELLLEWLDYQGGTIRAVDFTDGLDIALIIEHEDMPIIGELECIPIVRPQYTRETAVI